MTKSPLPLHLRPSAIVVVFAGGAVGTLTRYLIGLVLPPVAGLPVATLLVNLVGAFLLGLLLGGIARRGIESRRGRTLRLLLGTGFMGGFTTYSSLAVETTQLIGNGSGWLGAAYSLGTLALGLVLSLAGIALGGAITRPRTTTPAPVYEDPHPSATRDRGSATSDDLAGATSDDTSGAMSHEAGTATSRESGASTSRESGAAASHRTGGATALDGAAGTDGAAATDAPSGPTPASGDQGGTR